MRRTKICLLILFGIACIAFPVVAAQKKANKSRLTAYRDNNCVVCHSGLLEPVRVSAHFYEWLNSMHEKKGVGCEKCHGGNPSAKDLKTAHTGVLRAAFPLRSDLSWIGDFADGRRDNFAAAVTNGPAGSLLPERAWEARIG